jgi:MFS transporter, PAT family, beta-lactamase induction signal transducer AmpG
MAGPIFILQMKTSFHSRPSVWCFTTYFTEGFPFGIVRMMSSVFFTDIGMRERYLGYLNALGLPWNAKFLWAPLVDIFGGKRRWMQSIQVIITLFSALIAALCFAAGGIQNAIEIPNTVFVLLFVATAFIAATNDIVIDGYYMDGLTDPGSQAAYTGYRVFAYRLALVAAKFGVIYTVGILTKNAAAGALYGAWGWGFLAAAVIMGLFTVFHLFALPRFDSPQKGGATAGKAIDDFLASFASYLEISRDKSVFALTTGIASAVLTFIVLVACKIDAIPAMNFGILALLAVMAIQAKPAVAVSLLFIIFYKIGDEIIFSMGTPFLKRYLLVSNIQLAWMSGLLGLLGSIAGTSAGGIWIKKTGLKKAIWPLTLLMNINILAYVWLAWHRPLATTFSGMLTIGSVYCYEQIAAGLGNAVLIVYILQTCKKEFKAGHYAIGSAFMSVFSTIFGTFSGIIVERAGYVNLFLLGFLATIPAMALMRFVKIRE